MKKGMTFPTQRAAVNGRTYRQCRSCGGACGGGYTRTDGYYVACRRKG